MDIVDCFDKFEDGSGLMRLPLIIHLIGQESRRSKQLLLFMVGQVGPEVYSPARSVNVMEFFNQFVTEALVDANAGTAVSGDLRLTQIFSVRENTEPPVG